MKTRLIMAGLVVVTAVAGHFFGRAQGEREVLAEREREADQRVAKQRAIGESIARHVRASDEIVLVIFDAKPELRQALAFQDDAWREKLANLLVNAPCEPRPHALWISSPHLEFKARGITTLSCMWNGYVLRAYAEGVSGDFLAGEAVTAELAAWVKAKMPAGSAQAE